MDKVLSFDDFGIGCYRQIELLQELKKKFKNFKCTLFTIPAIPDFQKEYIPFLESFLDKMGKESIEFAQHGLHHKRSEFEFISKEEAKEKLLKGYLPHKDYYVKGFKAPYWAICHNTYSVLKELGFWVAVLPHQLESSKDWGTKHEDLKGLKYYSVSDKFYHFQGHVGNVCGNGIEESFETLINLPEEGEFKFCSEMLCEL